MEVPGGIEADEAQAGEEQGCSVEGKQLAAVLDGGCPGDIVDKRHCRW